jgi:pyruvate-ferredoxin/flavodoxin oxidoreductase
VEETPSDGQSRRVPQRALNPHTHAVTRGGAENDDITSRLAKPRTLHVDHVIEVAEKYFKEATRLNWPSPMLRLSMKAIRRPTVIIAMGSVCETATKSSPK